jgi:hypothetical protein
VCCEDWQFPSSSHAVDPGILWRTDQRYRPGLAYMVGTGRLHGPETIEEKNLLLAPDVTDNSRMLYLVRAWEGSWLLTGTTQRQ